MKRSSRQARRWVHWPILRFSTSLRNASIFWTMRCCRASRKYSARCARSRSPTIHKKLDILRCYVHLMVHEAMKAAPTSTYVPHKNAAQRPFGPSPPLLARPPPHPVPQEKPPPTPTRPPFPPPFHPCQPPEPRGKGDDRTHHVRPHQRSHRAGGRAAAPAQSAQHQRDCLQSRFRGAFFVQQLHQEAHGHLAYGITGSCGLIIKRNDSRNTSSECHLDISDSL